jgi:hypothetical protein
MSSLTTYLNDHLAGSVTALELLERLGRLHRGTEREKLFQSLRREVEEDQKVLQQVLDQVGGKESRARKAAAWLTEKIGEAKLKALSATADRLPQLGNLDFDHLQRRATQQHEQVETQRIHVARVALVP